MSRVRAAVRTATMITLLGLVALIVPAGTVAPSDSVLVKVEKAESVDLARDVVWILAVGSDARPGEEMTRTRGDALQLVGINPRTGAATSIGIARDSYVSIPGSGSDRINAALTFGGPQLQAAAVADMIGIEPDYVVVTRFPFFENMINDIGGIKVDNPRPFSDSDLKVEGFKAGTIKLDGYNAMAFSRIRKTLPGGDFDRSANQQIVLAGIAARIGNKANDRGFIERGVTTVVKHTDTNIPPGELFRIARAVARVDSTKITGCVVPGGIGQVGAASVVIPDLTAARSYGDQARDDAVIEKC